MLTQAFSETIRSFKNVRNGPVTTRLRTKNRFMEMLQNGEKNLQFKKLKEINFLFSHHWKKVFNCSVVN